MDSDHWQTRVRGGRRALLKLWLYGSTGTVCGGLAGNAGWDLLKWGWHAFTAPRNIVDARGTASGRATVTGVGESVTLEPLRIAASGTVSDQPAQIA